MTVEAQEKAVFAAGCFWCIQKDMDAVSGVLKTTVGYTGGTSHSPTYEAVSEGDTGHFEAIEVLFDETQLSYPDLLKIFWRNVDPFNAQGQFCDVGDQYRSAIFYVNDNQRVQAQASLEALPFEQVATLILPAGDFYPAEDYHQSYYEKNPIRYKFYRYSCGRDSRLEEVWREIDN